MRSLRSLALAFALFSSSGVLLSQQSPVPTSPPPSDPLAALRATLRNDISASQTRSAPGPGNRIGAEQSALYALERASSEDSASAEDNLRQLLNADLPDSVRAQVTAALQHIQEMRAARANSYQNDVNAALQRASAAVLKAQKARELDPVIVDLRKVMEVGRSGRDPTISEKRNQVERAVRFVQTWQDYLWDMENGKFGSAGQKLMNLSQGEEIFPGLGRSGILERIRTTEEAQKNLVKSALQKIKTLDDLTAVFEELRGDSSYNSSGNTQRALNALEPIYKTYLAFKNGWATTLPVGFGNFAEADPVVARLRTELFLRVLPRVLGVEGKMDPIANETIDQYLTRVWTSAVKSGDSDLLGRIISVTRDVSFSLTGSTGPAWSQDYSAFIAFREGQNDERAHRFSDAVLAYRNALRTGSLLVPADVIGQRITAIEKENPADYQRAMEMVQRADGREFHPQPPEPSNGLQIPPLPSPSSSSSPSPSARAPIPHG